MTNLLSRLWLIGYCLLCASGCSAPKSDHLGEDPALVPTLRVLTYNIHHGEGVDGVFDLDRIAGVIRESRADLVALQEVDVRASRTGGVDQLDTLARLTGMHGAFTPFMDFQGGQYGLAVLSRYPLDQTEPLVLPPGKHEPRSALAATVVVPEFGTAKFVCLHFDWLDDDADRFMQAQALVRALDGEPRVILAGDFNDQPGSRTMEYLSGSFMDVAKSTDAACTFPSGTPDREIDFVMFRPKDALLGTAQVLGETTASDHRPVLATLRFPR